MNSQCQYNLYLAKGASLPVEKCERLKLKKKSFTYFVSCNGPCAPKEKWHRKEHIIIIILDFNVLSSTQDHLRTNEGQNKFS